MVIRLMELEVLLVLLIVEGDGLLRVFLRSVVKVFTVLCGDDDLLGWLLGELKHRDLIRILPLEILDNSVDNLFVFINTKDEIRNQGIDTGRPKHAVFLV